MAAVLSGASAQAGSLVDLDVLGLEAYGGPHFRASPVDGEWGLMGGGPAMVLVPGRYGFGFNFATSEGDIDGRWFAYGGPRAEIVLAKAGRWGLSFGQTLAGGALVPTTPDRRGAAFVVVEPDFVLSYRVLQSLRPALGAGYRWVPWADDGAEDMKLSGPFLDFSLQYGVFGDAGDRPAPPRWQLSGYYCAKVTTLAGGTTWLDGGGTRLLLGKNFAVGATGFVSRSDVRYDGHDVAGGYGGLDAAWTFFPDALVHPVASLTAGVGGAGWTDGDEETATMAVFVEPEACAEVNVATFARFAAGAGYRRAVFVADPDILDAGDLSAPAGFVQLRFGWF